MKETEVETEPETKEAYPIILHLGERGWEGSNLRSSPEMIKDNIVDTVHGDVELLFENEIQETEGTIWVKISTDKIPEVWISSRLLNADEAKELLGIEIP